MQNDTYLSIVICYKSTSDTTQNSRLLLNDDFSVGIYRNYLAPTTYVRLIIYIQVTK